MKSTPLIALDWGSTNVRASLLDTAGRAVDTRQAARGILSVTDGGFGEVLEQLCGDWLAQSTAPVLASGMIGSRQGWKEAPYLDCPAGAAGAARALAVVETGVHGRTLHIVPGVRCRSSSGVWDVMRGEETQIWGALCLLQATGKPRPRVCVLPGTHSKWAWLDAQARIQRFETYMTGERVSVLCQHSILGKLMEAGQDRPHAFDQGAALGLERPERITHLLFSARTQVLLGGLQPDDVPDYLSGLLIGAEVAGAMRGPGAHEPPQLVTLIGNENLCSRYAKVLAMSGVKALSAPADAANFGLWQIANFLRI